MAYGRFNGGQHFNYLRKGMKDTSTKQSPRATEGQLQALKDLGFEFQTNSISKVRATHLISTIKAEKQERLKTVK